MTSKLKLGKDTASLSHELIMRRYIFDRQRILDALDRLTLVEYIALHYMHENERTSDRTYLKDICEHMEIPTRMGSRLMTKLKGRGLISWSHDGDGSDGTYTVLTDTGNALLEDQDIRFKDYFDNVIEEFGKDRMYEMLTLLREFEDILDSQVRQHDEEIGAVENEITEDLSMPDASVEKSSQESRVTEQ